MTRNDPASLRRLIGRRVAAARRARSWTQEQLAEALGVSTRYEQSVEAGVENLTIETMCKIGDALDLHVSDLLGPEQGDDGSGASSGRRRGRPNRAS